MININEIDFQVNKLTETSTWLFAKFNACKYEHFVEFPDTVVVLGKAYRKRSFVHDGVMYVHGDDPILKAESTLQYDVTEWTRQIFTTATPISVAERVIEEGEELVDAAKKYSSFVLSHKDSPEDNTAKLAELAKEVGMECADILHCLFDLCALISVDLFTLTREKLAINKNRQWGEPDKDNQRRHIKPESAENFEDIEADINRFLYRTSAQWLQSRPGLIITEASGWDKNNFEYAFNEEKITEEEFNKRLFHSRFIGNQ